MRKIVADISDPNVGKGEAVLYLLFFIPIICMAIDKFPNIAHDAMEHGYDIKVKAGPVDIALTKKNFMIEMEGKMKKTIGI
jgi:hypothetical protein